MEQMINLGGVSAKLLFWLLMCPKCLFETDIKLIGHQLVTYEQKVVCECPNCKKMIIKTVGVDLGVMDGDLKYSPDKESGSCDDQI